MKIPKARLLLLGCLTLLFSSHLFAQLYEVSLNEKIAHSQLIVEGRVVSRQSFWNTNHTFIFTSNKVAITKIFKGAPQGSLIEIVTAGGTIDNHHIEASDLLKLQTNELGVFFCYENAIGLRSPETGNILMDVYGSAQGFFKYDLATMSASAPFVHYASIYNELYPALQRISGNSGDIQSGIRTGNEYTKISGAQSIATANAPSITSFSPSMVTAGTYLDPANNLLTIDGSGFGNSPSGSAAVIFDNPDDGPGGATTTIPYSSGLVVSWTDTRIRIRVPDLAGTGALQVVDASGTGATAASNLTVLFSIFAGDFWGTNSFLEARMVNYDGLGGYTVVYSTSTANSGVDINASPAKGTFQRALNTWKEISGFNVTEGGTTTIQAADIYDDINVIMFDNGATGQMPLAAGVLAVCYSGFGGCPGDPAVFKTNFDIVIRSAYSASPGSVNFTLGPCPPITTSTTDVDLETVLLHELGHALNLGHIIDGSEGTVFGKINPVKVMNYAVGRGRRRTSPDYSAASGSAYQTNSMGIVYGAGCGGPAIPYMVPFTRTVESKDECPSTFPTTMTPLNTIVTFDLVHATSNKYADPSYLQVYTDGTGTSLTNTAYYAFKTGAAGGSLSLTVSGYTTTPASLVSCTSVVPGLPATGVSMSVYPVSSCPAAQSYPTPIAYREFSGDGAISAITGLAASSTYLMMLDGLENTKATFNINFAGSALPITKTDFSGVIRNSYNQLSWSIELAPNVKSVAIQRSADGVRFDKFADIETRSEKQIGKLNDATPIRGNNYYRIVVENTDGSIQYSKIILLKRTETLLMTAYPNPSTEMINLDIAAEPGRYMVMLHNTFGQLLQQKSIRVSTSHEHVSFKVDNYPAGLYHVSVYDERGNRLGSTKIMH